MTAVHYATYFDVAPVLTILLHRTKVFRKLWLNDNKYFLEI